MIYFNFEEKIKIEEKTLLINGRFETFHKGHKHLISTAKEYAKIHNLKTILMIYPESKDDFFSLQERKLIIQNLGLDYVMMFSPTRENYQLTIKDFVEQIKNNFGVEIIFAGDDFTFHKTDDDYSLIKEYIDIKLVDRKRINGQVISTSLIKEALKSAEIELVNNLLGFNYFYMGRVVPGNQIGSSLGFPTANVNFNINKVNVGEGIYLSYLIYDGKKYPSITSISNNPTIENINYLKYETYILNFNKIIYGQDVRIELIKLIRKPKKFPGKVELLAAMNNDKRIAINYFTQPKNNQTM